MDIPVMLNFYHCQIEKVWGKVFLFESKWHVLRRKHWLASETLQTNTMLDYTLPKDPNTVCPKKGITPIFL